MSLTIVGLTTLGGVPLFHRTVTISRNSKTSGGGGAQDHHQQQQEPQPESETANELPFASLAALNGVHLFSRLNDVDLQATSTDQGTIVWKVFSGSITLYLYSDLIPREELSQLMEYIFSAAILLCGAETIVSQNVERLKRSLRAVLPFMDFIAREFLAGSLLEVTLNCVNYSCLSPASTGRLNYLMERALELTDTNFVAVFMSGRRIVAASRSWWTKLSPSADSVIIHLWLRFQCSLRQAAAGGYAGLGGADEWDLFLPHICPNSATRLIACPLVRTGRGNVAALQLVLLSASASPTLRNFEDQFLSTIAHSQDCQTALYNIAHHEKNFCLHKLDPRIISLVAFRMDHRLYLMYRQAGHAANNGEDIAVVDDWMRDVLVREAESRRRVSAPSAVPPFRIQTAAAAAAEEVFLQAFHNNGGGTLSRSSRSQIPSKVLTHYRKNAAGDLSAILIRHVRDELGLLCVLPGEATPGEADQIAAKTLHHLFYSNKYSNIWPNV